MAVSIRMDRDILNPRMSNHTMHNILVVEDDVYIAETLKQMLETASLTDDGIRRIHVDIAALMAEALALLPYREYGSICLDLKLPDSRGTKTYQAIREHNPRAFICVLSGNGADLKKVSKIVDSNRSLRLKPDSPGAVEDILGQIAIDLTVGAMSAAG